MKRTFLSSVLYLLVGLASLGLGLYMATTWLIPSYSQEPVDKAAPSAPQPVTLKSEIKIKNQTINDLLNEDFGSYLLPFIYDINRRRDPFEPYDLVRPENNVSGPSQGPLLPLQRYTLDEINLIGVIWDVREPRAMIMDSNKKIHTVGKDDRIGRSGGYVAVIREGEIVVVEPVIVKGETTYTTRILKIDR